MKPVITFLLLCCLTVPAHAQVVINQAALVQLAGITPQAAQPAAVSRPANHHWARRTYAMRPRPPAAAGPTAVAMVLLPPRTAPKAPAAPAIQPAVARPAPRKPPAPLALHFAPGSATLPPGAAAALNPLCGAAGTGFISIAATAPGDPSDPSIAMRLSMSRAFAVRDALTACGVPATRILPLALGDVPGKDENTARVTGGPTN